MSQIVPVVLSGGAGTRLWPASRACYPKQFLDLGQGRSLLQTTLRRFAGETDFTAPLVIANEEQRFLVGAQAQECGTKLMALLIEPLARDTAFAIAAAATWLAASRPDALMLVMPADQVVADTAVLSHAIRQAVQAARSGYLVTFGIKPTRAEVGFGYIHAGDGKVAGEVLEVLQFVEKPDRRLAEAYVAGGRHYWNSGIFLFEARAVLSEMAAHAPSVLEAATLATERAATDLDFVRLDRSAMEPVSPISIDYAVFQVSSRIAMQPVQDCGWSDVGSWDALHQVTHRDERDNAVFGSAMMIDADRNIAYIADERHLVAYGVSDLAIVSTPDAMLVTRRNLAQDVKQIVERLRQSHPHLVEHNHRVHRPWGHFERVHGGNRHQVKHIYVKPGGRLSLQRHLHRAEHWVVVSGTARVTKGNEILELSENESVYVPLGCLHRLENTGRIPLSLIEVQSGGYLGEDDIERFDDCYGRS